MPAMATFPADGAKPSLPVGAQGGWATSSCVAGSVPVEIDDLMMDPQTSGGLLASVPKQLLSALLDGLEPDWSAGLLVKCLQDPV